MRQYYYLVSSLPSLDFGIRRPLEYPDFLKRCSEQLSLNDMRLVKAATIIPGGDFESASGALGQWQTFEANLRDELTRMRALRKSEDASKFIRGQIWTDPFLSSFIRQVGSLESPLEAEIALDRARWQRLEELSRGHFFDIYYLITYALKLQILERWDRINEGEGKEILREVVSEVIA